MVLEIGYSSARKWNQERIPTLAVENNVARGILYNYRFLDGTTIWIHQYQKNNGRYKNKKSYFKHIGNMAINGLILHIRFKEGI